VKRCNICGQPMMAGQQFHHHECKRLADAGLRHEPHRKTWLTSEYRDYLNSPEWRLLRRELITAADGRCTRCKSPTNLHAHHVTYARLGNEAPGDVLILCDKCHNAEHVRLDEERRFDGWAFKIYGDAEPPDDAWDRFEDWLERREFA
jgi:5-methylcytosine-specific restriction endonuclease McrA